MMELQRNFFIFAFLFVSFLLWQAWQNQLPTKDKIVNATNSIMHFKHKKEDKKQIVIQSDVLRLVINMYGGDIEEASLLNYKYKLNSSKPLKLLETTSDFVYQAQSGLIGKDGPDSSMNKIRPLYSSKKNFFEFGKNQHELSVPIT